MRNKFVTILASVAMVFGSSGVSVYAEETPAPSESPTVTETTPAAEATPAATPNATPESTPAASVTPKATPNATPESTPSASTEPTPSIPPAVPPQPIEVSPWLSDWEYTVDADANTITISEYLPKAPIVDGFPDTLGWNPDITVPATATVTRGDTTKEFQIVLASRLSTKETMATVRSISFEPGVKMSSDSSYLFSNFKVRSIDCRGLDTTGVTDLSYGFPTWDIRSVNLSGLDLSGVTNMEHFVDKAYGLNYITAPAKLPDGVSLPLPSITNPEYDDGWPISFYHLNDDGSVDESAEYSTLESIPADMSVVRREPIVVWFGGMKLADYQSAMDANSVSDYLGAVNVYDTTVGTDIPAGAYRFGLYRDTTSEADLGTPVETMTIDVAEDHSATCTLYRDGAEYSKKACKVGVLNDGDLPLSDLPTFERRYYNSNYLVLMQDPDGNPLTKNMDSYTENGNIIHFVNREGDFGKIEGVAGLSPTDSGQVKSAAVRGFAYEPDTAVTVTYDPGYDGATAAVENTTQGASINLADHALTRDGYVFLGWNDGTASYLYSDTYTVPADTHAVTLTGQWAPINVNTTITVDYNVNGGNKSSAVLTLPLSANDEAMASDGGGIASGSDSTTARISISANALGTTTYTVTPGTPNLVDYALDSADTHTVAVTVDNENGALNVSASVDGGETQPVQSFKVVNDGGVLGLATVEVNQVNAGTYTLHHVDPTNAADTLAAQVNLDKAPSAGAQVVVDDKDVKTSDDNGVASYEYSHAEGTHTYTIRQNLTTEQKADKNVKYDETVYTVTYTTHRASADETNADYLNLVSDVVIKTDAGFVTDKVVFNNYTVPADPSDVSLTGTVTFDNKFHKVDSFPFEILDESGKQIEKVDPIDGGFKFSDLHYDKAGTHTYTVKQIIGNDETIDYDTSVYTVTVVTKKGSVDGKNAYISTVTLKKDGKDANEIHFANTTKDPNPATANEVAYGDEGSKVSFNDTTKTVKNGTADNKETFHDVGTYTVIVKQNLTDEQLIDENWNYDKSIYTVTYTVTRDGNSLSETHVITDSEGNVVDKIVFHNTKNDPKPSWTVLSGTVTIDNDKRVKQGLDPINSFEIDMYDENGKLVESVDSVDGKFKFSPLSFFAEGTHTYTIKQKVGDDPTVEYSDVVYTVTLDTHLRDSTPKLNEYFDAISIDASIHGQKPAGAEFIQFANITYEPNPVEFNMKGIVLRNGNAPTAETFDFTATHDKAVTKVKSVKDLVDFEKMKVSTPGTYTFTLTQTPGTIKSLKYDTSVYTAKIAVTRKGNDLNYEISYRDADGNSVDHPVWNNVTADAFKTVKPLDVSKYFSGAVVLNEKKPTCPCFDFTLSESNTRTLAAVKGPVDYTGWADEVDPNEVKLIGGTISYAESAYRKDSVIQAVKNNNGGVDFSGVTVDHAGTYTFTMREVEGNNKNINYGTGDVYVVTLKVSRDWKTGALQVDGSEIRKNGNLVKADDVIFKNTTKTAYQAAKATTAPTATPTATPTAAPSASPAANATASENPKSGADGYLGYIPGAAIAAAGIVVLLVLKKKTKTAE